MMIITPQPAHENNYRPGRAAPIRAIVIHISTSTLQSMTNWFQNAEAAVSAHYGVARDGRVVQYVDDADTAFHAGKTFGVTAPLVRELGGNPNDYTIGVEHEGTIEQEPTEAQMDASAHLLVTLCARYSIPLDSIHIIPHRAIRSDKTCPGKIHVPELIARAKALTKVGPPGPIGEAGSNPGKPSIGDRRYSNYLEEDIILTEYRSDTDWRFVRLSEIRGKGVRGSVPWSALKKSPP